MTGYDKVEIKRLQGKHLTKRLRTLILHSKVKKTQTLESRSTFPTTGRRSLGSAEGVEPLLSWHPGYFRGLNNENRVFLGGFLIIFVVQYTPNPILIINKAPILQR